MRPVSCFLWFCKVIIHRQLFCYTLNNTYTKVCKVSSQCCNVHICVWRSKWDLLLNPTKSYWHIHFHFSQVRKFTPDQQYFICNNSVSNDQIIKDLQCIGILYTSSLQWDLHCKSIIYLKLIKCSRYWSALNFTTLSQIARKSLYFTLLTYLVYCSPLWRPHLMKNIKNLKEYNGMLGRSTKLILNNYHLSYKSWFLQCRMLPLMYS